MLLSACIIGLLAMTGCQYTATPADLLISARATPENAELAAAVRDALPPRAKLTVPDHDQSISAVRKVDIDGDGRQEALVTFMNDAEVKQLMVLKNKGDGWKLWFIFGESSNYGIDFFEAADLDGDGKLELLVGWNEFGDPEHALNIYRVDPDEVYHEPPKPIAEIEYSLARVGDVTGDGRTEVVLIRNDREQMKTTLYVYRMEQGNLRNVISVPLESGVNGYYNMAIGQVAVGRYGIVADAGVGAHSSMTTMLAWENGKLIKIFPRSAAGEAESGNFYSTISGDSNNDGILDIIMMREAPGQAEDIPYSETLWIEQRKQWDGGDNFDIISEQYSDYNKRYALKFPDRWRGKITLSRPESAENGQVLFSVLSASEKVTIMLPLLAIHSIPVKEWNTAEQAWQAKGAKYAEITQAAGLVYAVEWKEAREDWTDEEQLLHAQMSPDIDEIKQMFAILAEY